MQKKCDLYLRLKPEIDNTYDLINCVNLYIFP